MRGIELGKTRYDYDETGLVRYFDAGTSTGLIRVPFDSKDNYTYTLTVEANEPLRVVAGHEIEGAILLGPNRETLIRYIQSDKTMDSLIGSLIDRSVSWQPDSSVKIAQASEEWVIE